MLSVFGECERQKIVKTDNLVPLPSWVGKKMVKNPISSYRPLKKFKTTAKAF